MTDKEKRQINKLLSEETRFMNELPYPAMIKSAELVEKAFSVEDQLTWQHAAAILASVASVFSTIDFQRVQNAVVQFEKCLEESFNRIQSLLFPSISEEQRKALTESYRKWGRIGWTTPIDAPLRFFDIAPDANVTKAHKRVMAFFRVKSDVTRLCGFIRRYYPNSPDFDSAVFCFENRQYKACALLLFGLIESKLIDTQDKKSHLKTGFGAIKCLEKKQSGVENDGALVFYLHSVNMFSCLLEMFRDTENFTLKPRAINRNYLSHGKNKKSVLRRDCIQLFLVLANLSVFLRRMNASQSRSAD